MEKRPSKNQPEKEKKGKLWNETKKKNEGMDSEGKFS